MGHSKEKKEEKYPDSNVLKLIAVSKQKKGDLFSHFRCEYSSKKQTSASNNMWAVGLAR